MRIASGWAGVSTAVFAGDVTGGVFGVGVILGSGVASGDERVDDLGKAFGEVEGGCGAVDGISLEAVGCAIGVGGEVAGTSGEGFKEGVGDATAGVTGGEVADLSNDEVD